MAPNDPNEKARAIFAAMESMDTLESLPRSGFLLRRVRLVESVAAHCFGTAFLALLLADSEGGVDTEKVLRMAIVHETGEARMTDLPRPAKQLFSLEAIDRAERIASAQVLEGLERKEHYLALIDEYQKGQTREAKLVCVADKLQMLCKVRFYEKAGAANLEEFFENDQGMDLSPFPVAQALYLQLSTMKPG